MLPTNFPNRGIYATLLIASVVVGMSIVTGVVIAMLSPSITIRLTVFASAIFSLFFAWGFRRESNHPPHKLIINELLLTVILSIIWPRYIFLHVGGLPSANPLTLLSLFGLYLFFLLYIYSPEFSQAINKALKKSNWLGKLFLIWLLWRFIACLAGSSPIFSIMGFARELIYVSSFFLFGLTISTYPKGGQWLFRIVIGCGVLVGAYGMVESIVARNFFSQFASAGENADLTGVVANIAADKMRAGGYRAQSTFDHPIVFAQFVAAMLPISLFGVLREKNLFWKLTSLASIPIGIFAIAMSGSRSGLASIVIVLFVLGFITWIRAMIHGKITKAIAIIVLPAMIGAVGIGYMILQELSIGRSQQEMGSTGYRVQMVNHGVTALIDSPFMGFGQGIAIFKAGITTPSGLATIDNYFLSMALDSGYIGLFLMLSIIIYFSVMAFKTAVLDATQNGFFVAVCLSSFLAIMASFGVLSILNNITLAWLLMTVATPCLTNNQELMGREI